MTPEETFTAYLPPIRRMVEFHSRRFHFRREEAEDLLSTVKLKLIEDDYKVFRQYKGGSKIESYLSVVVARKVSDHLNHLWGKWRPSAAALDRGPVAVELDRLLRRDGHSFDEACEILWTNLGATESRAELYAIAVVLPVHTLRRIEGEEQLAALPALDGSPEQRVRERERNEARTKALDALRWALDQLSPEDRLIIKMRAEGVQIAQIARSLRRDEKPLYNHLKKILKKLRQAMERQGVHADDIRGILSDA